MCSHGNGLGERAESGEIVADLKGAKQNKSCHKITYQEDAKTDYL